jgi:hypothetical protein
MEIRTGRARRNGDAQFRQFPERKWKPWQTVATSSPSISPNVLPSLSSHSPGSQASRATTLDPDDRVQDQPKWNQHCRNKRPWQLLHRCRPWSSHEDLQGRTFCRRHAEGDGQHEIGRAEQVPCKGKLSRRDLVFIDRSPFTLEFMTCPSSCLEIPRFWWRKPSPATTRIPPTQNTH